jgi:hypothetical protein
MSKSSGNTVFAEFADDLLRIPWGSLSKSELEFRLFLLLVEAGKLKLEWSDVRLAQELSTNLTKIRTLRFKAQQRQYRGKTTWDWNELLDKDRVTLNAVDKSGDELVLHVKDSFLKDVLTEKLRESPNPVLVRSSLTPGHLKVDVIDFWSKVLNSGGLSEQEIGNLRDTMIAALPERKKGVVSKAFNVADKGAGAANIASFGVAFAALLSGKN